MTAKLSITRKIPATWMAIFTAFSWLGEYIHNRFELPQLTLLSPDNSIIAVITIALFLIWWLFPSRKEPGIVLLGWGLLHLIGGAILSVIPFRFLPFYPEQSVGHYLSHVVYGLAQLPLIGAMIWQARH